MVRSRRRRARLGSLCLNERGRVSLIRWAVVVGVWLALPATAIAQAVEPVRRTPWGDPDLQGMWPTSSVSTVPFERSEDFGTRTVLTDEELAARIERYGTFENRSFSALLEIERVLALASLVVDPEDGRLPPMTADGARRAEEWLTKYPRPFRDRRRGSAGWGAPTYAYAGAEDLRPYDRCITRGLLGSAFPNIYASAVQIFQSPGVVVIHYEMIHESRVIPLDGRPHLASGIRQWMGDSHGRWEGDTLVVETTNFNGRTGSYVRNGDGNPTTEALRLVERYRLQDADTLHFEVRIEDPRTWRRPWTVAFPVLRDDDYVMYEYACHEGNYALANILRTVRAAEQAVEDGEADHE